jgi:hypothetical protein
LKLSPRDCRLDVEVGSFTNFANRTISALDLHY